LTSTGG
jgi:hypothetical protein